MSDTSARLLQLLSLLQTPREWPGSELAERLGVTDRTVRRDIDRLRDLGYPVEATMGATGGYRLVAGAAMPPLLVDDEEAVAIAVGLRAAAGSAIAGIEEASVRALAKLEQVLPSKLRRRVRVLGAAVVPATGGNPVDPELLATLAAAITNRERVRFAYESAAGTESRRNTEPVGLVPYKQRWYLVGFDLDRNDWRVFRADRIQRAHPTGARFTPRDLPAESPAAYVTGARTNWGTPGLHYLVNISAPPDAVIGRLGEAPGDIVARGENTCVLDMRRDDLPEWVAHRLLELGFEFQVHSPDALVAAIRTIGDRARRALET
ncbi:YafY family transcriptional regulator [Nocardia yunnanensis]|uniref:YafY family transcriptional regulator n=1 Tax=Nocardia yunnanensis TaxID=2382165 RepID=A0A386ZNQ5_9NOCA|nr:YafY family protein [Nocardia yunnanensis]AYF78804.1 YafY family transcriptional regulator [Nocardia yunnanensis]